jgi:hypothetical protein
VESSAGLEFASFEHAGKWTPAGLPAQTSPRMKGADYPRRGSDRLPYLRYDRSRHETRQLRC